MISKDTIGKILDAVRIEEVIEEFVSLKKSGSSYRGLSPFSQEKTPSFYVVPSKGIFKDFSSGKGGSVITFLMEHEGLTYPEALRWLAQKYNIEIEEKEITPEEQEKQSERESMYLVLGFARDYFQDIMLNTDAGKSIGLSYFKERGFTPETIESFQLGYHPDDRHALTNAAKEKGYNEAWLQKLGLQKVSDSGQKNDFFRGRVMFPIHNLTGRVLGFGGRILRSDKKAAKYFNSPESEVYNKSRVLYGLYQAKQAISSQDNCFLVEGYTDVLAMHQAGIKNVVASSGTALTEGQLNLIKRFTPNITMLFDGDAAGVKASFRSIDMALDQGMNTRLVLLPDGHDPDSFSKEKSADELQEYLLKNSEDFISFKAKMLLKDSGNDPIKKATVVKDIVASIAHIPDSITRSVYTKTCASLLDTPERALIAELNKHLREKVRQQARKEGDYQELPEIRPEPQQPDPETIFKTGKQEKIQAHEAELLRVMILYGNDNFVLKGHDDDGEEVEGEQNVAEFIIETLENDEIEFTHLMHQQVFQALTEEKYLEQLNLITSHPNQAVAGFATQCLDPKHQLSKSWKEKHQIYTVEEKQRLDKAVLNPLYSFMLAKIDEVLVGLRDEIKVTTDTETVMQKMAAQMEYEKAKIAISQKLERVISF